MSFLKGRMEGGKAINKNLALLKKAIQRRVLRKAVTAASKPVLAAAKAKAPRETDLLLKSLGRKTKTYRSSGVAVAIVGPREGFGREVEVNGEVQIQDPIFYAHLVELGTFRTSAQPFMRPAFESTKEQAKSITAKKIAEEIDRELSK